MKRFLFLFLALALFSSVQILTVHAQATILPKPGEEADCKGILDDYEVSGELPKAVSDEALSAANESLASYDDAQKALDEAKAAQAEVVQQYKAAGCMEKDLGTKEFEDAGCLDFKKKEVDTLANAKEAQQKFDDATTKLNESTQALEEAPNDLANLLGCAIQTGRISLQMIPYFITYLINWVLGLIGIASVLFIVIGGYFYIYGGLTDNKERGKKYITNALIGMSLAFLAWVIVQAIITAITS